MENNKNRYGNLLDNVMKKKDDKMINTAEKLMDSMSANRQAEIDRRNSALNARERKEQAERNRVRQTNATVDKWIDVIKKKEEAKQKQREAEQQAMKDAEMRRKTNRNLNWTP